jgi:hypothetical protein
MQNLTEEMLAYYGSEENLQFIMSTREWDFERAKLEGETYEIICNYHWDESFSGIDKVRKYIEKYSLDSAKASLTPLVPVELPRKQKVANLTAVDTLQKIRALLNK